VSGDVGWRWAWLLVALCAAAWLGCPAGNDDDAADDDAADDDAADDDGADDDSADPYARDQTLLGTEITDEEQICQSCNYTFEVTYLTADEDGECNYCGFFPDGVYTLAYDSNYYGGGSAIFYGYGGHFYYWYAAYPGAGGHSFEFYYQQGGYTQMGYWDVDHGSMTGMAYYTEP